MKYSMTQDLYDNGKKSANDVEYEVDYDPEILADIQRMQNWFSAQLTTHSQIMMHRQIVSYL